jgi:hypothetical protein
MTRHEREEFRPETRDVIEGLRRLALDAEPPTDLLARVKQWGDRASSEPRHDIGRWRRVLPLWAWRPVVWGPAIAVLCFIAGVFVPPPGFTPWRGEVRSKAPALPPKQSPGEVSSAQVTITLSAALYEQLLREAQRRQEDLPAILHEAVVTYLHTGESE